MFKPPDASTQGRPMVLTVIINLGYFLFILEGGVGEFRLKKEFFK
jgi:hypothetical protein